MDRESDSAIRDPIRAANTASDRGDDVRDAGEAGRDTRAENRLRGWGIAVGVSLVLWGGIVAVVWLVATVLG